MAQKNNEDNLVSGLVMSEKEKKNNETNNQAFGKMANVNEHTQKKQWLPTADVSKKSAHTRQTKIWCKSIWR